MPENEPKTFSLGQVAKASDNMQKYGGGFASALGWAMVKADADNLQRIVNAFPELIERYSKF